MIRGVNVTGADSVNPQFYVIQLSNNQFTSFNHLKDEKINDAASDNNELAGALSRNQPYMPSVIQRSLQNHGLIVDIYGSFKNGTLIF